MDWRHGWLEDITSTLQCPLSFPSVRSTSEWGLAGDMYILSTKPTLVVKFAAVSEMCIRRCLDAAVDDRRILSYHAPVSWPLAEDVIWADWTLRCSSSDSSDASSYVDQTMLSDGAITRTRYFHDQTCKVLELADPLDHCLQSVLQLCLMLRYAFDSLQEQILRLYVVFATFLDQLNDLLW